jgi:hypothetical protein
MANNIIVIFVMTLCKEICQPTRNPNWLHAQTVDTLVSPNFHIDNVYANANIITVGVRGECVLSK